MEQPCLLTSTRGSQWFIVLALGLGLTLVPILLAPLTGQGRTVRADPGTLFVATDGDDGNPCTQAEPCRTVQRAVDLAAAGYTIKVATGVYADVDTPSLGYVLALTKTVTLRGGYDTSFADPPDPEAHPTTLDALRQGRVINITGDISPTLEGFIITGGDATGLGETTWGQDAGGGIVCHGAHPIIVNNVITNNVASSGTSVSGGGVFLEYCQRAVVSRNTIVSNTASTGGFGRGGGICLEYSDAVVSGNIVVSNTASTGGTGFGGGLYLYLSDATISDNTVQGNVGSTSNDAEGGGIWIQYGIVTVSDNTVQSNTAQTPNGGAGGGVFVVYGDGVTLDDNLIINNVAYEGSAVAISQGSTFTLTNNIIARNQAGYRGGGLRFSARDVYPSTGTLLHNTIADNRGISREGLYIGNYVTLDLINNIIAGHSVGITNINPANSTVTADYTLFSGNDTDCGSGVSSGHEVSGNPRFVDPAAPDYHISPGSVAIDAGVDVGVTTDIDGDPRPNGLGYDIGADEFYCYAPTGVSISGPVTGTVGTAYTFTATAPPTVTLPITYAWQATGQSPVTHTGNLSDTVVFTWAVTGTKAITVTAENCGGVASDTHTIAITAPPPTWRYVYLPLVVKNRAP